MENSLFYQQELVNQSRSITGIDADLISLKKNQCIHRKVLGDIQNLCFKNSSFDLVTANMVVEHVRNPELLLLEVKRVLAPGGLFMFHTPNLRGYTTLIANNIPGIFKKKLIYFLQGRKDEDVFPAFYRLNTHKAVSKIASEVKFDIEEIQMLESSTQTFKLGPIVLVELAWIRMLRSFKLVKYYTNMIVMLRKY
jgi:ubiquinone/menaquinone biosynthesis C-methylase UbiE